MPENPHISSTMYPSPFLVITPTDYTKHYYAGTERIAARVDKGNKIQHTKPLPSGLTGSPLGVGKMNKSLKKTNIK